VLVLIPKEEKLRTLFGAKRAAVAVVGALPAVALEAHDTFEELPLLFIDFALRALGFHGLEPLLSGENYAELLDRAT
jgi:hypothetical protein